jgi:hypothetical protein
MIGKRKNNDGMENANSMKDYLFQTATTTTATATATTTTKKHNHTFTTN